MKIKNVYGRDLRDITLEGYGAIPKGKKIKADEIIEVKDPELAKRCLGSGRYEEVKAPIVKKKKERE